MPDFTLLGLGDDEAAGFFAECHRLVANYLRMEDPQHSPPDRARAAPQRPGRRPVAARHHRPPRAARRRAGGHRLQDRPAAVVELGTAQPGRRPLLRLPLPAGVRPAPGRRPPAVPQQRRDHRGHAVRAVGTLRRVAHRGGVARRREGLHEWRRSRPARARCARRAATSAGARRSAATPIAPTSRRRSPSASPRPERHPDGPPTTPGVGALGPAIERFDEWADAQLERLRGTPVADRCSRPPAALGDFSVVWHILNVTRGVRRWATPTTPDPGAGAPDRRREPAREPGHQAPVRPSAPHRDGDDRFDVRTPSTSSFPSGHASAAGFAAATLTAWDGPASALLWWPIAATSPRRVPTSASTTRPTCSPAWPWA